MAAMLRFAIWRPMLGQTEVECKWHSASCAHCWGTATYVWATEVTGAHPIRFLPPPVCKTPPPGPPVSAPGGLCTGQKAAAYPPVGVTADTWHCCDSGGIPG